MKIGLALGAGGAKGLSHIGVIKIFEKNNIPIDFIAGSSIGAMIGGLYAYKKNIAEIEKLALETNWKQILPLFFDPSILHGLIKGNKIHNFIQNYLKETDFASLQIPFQATATSVSDAHTKIFKTGKVAPAIITSISVPFFFKPTELEGHWYIDGGISLPVPVSVVQDMGADIVIAVNLKEDFRGVSPKTRFGIYAVSDRSIEILSYYLARENCKTADITVCPRVGQVGLFDKFLTKQGTLEVIKLGEEETEKMIPKIKALIEKREKPENILSRILRFLHFS